MGTHSLVGPHTLASSRSAPTQGVRGRVSRRTIRGRDQRATGVRGAKAAAFWDQNVHGLFPPPSLRLGGIVGAVRPRTPGTSRER